jgi:hypothetical protein
LPSPVADSIAQVRWSPSGAAHCNSWRAWPRSATTFNLAIACSSPSIATAVWVALCGSIPIITDMKSSSSNAVERHDGHS